MQKNSPFFGPFSAATYRQRRHQLLKELSRQTSSDFVAFFWSGSELIRNNDNHYAFRAQSDFLYLTGFSEPDTMLILQSINGRKFSRLALRPRDLSANRGSEVWEGERLGVERAVKTLGVEEAFDIHQVSSEVEALLAKVPQIFWSFGEFPEWDLKFTRWIGKANTLSRGLPRIQAIGDARIQLHEMRRVKTAEEIKVMRESGRIASLGHIRAMKSLRPGRFEYEIASELEREFKKLGASDVAYGSIVAGGNNACTLHYKTNRERLKSGDLLLIDAGCEFETYASDITRVYPIAGKFSPAQAEVYNWVLKSQLAAIAACRPGAQFTAPHEAAVKVLAKGLIALGVIKRKSVGDILKHKLWRRYMPHGTSHWLGMDVHDTGTYTEEKNPMKPVRLRAGNVLTIEPGIYFRKDDKSVPPKYRGIGIRIEDDVLVTTRGHEVLTAPCPKKISDIEALCGPKM